MFVLRDLLKACNKFLLKGLKIIDTKMLSRDNNNDDDDNNCKESDDNIYYKRDKIQIAK